MTPVAAQVERREVDDAVERLVPLDVPRPVDLQRLDPREAAGAAPLARHRFDSPALRLQAAHPHVEDGVARSRPRRGGEQALGP